MNYNKLDTIQYINQKLFTKTVKCNNSTLKRNLLGTFNILSLLLKQNHVNILKTNGWQIKWLIFSDFQKLEKLFYDNLN